MAKKEFQMPAFGTPEFTELMAKWAERNISYGQCNLLKTKIKLAQPFLAKLNKKERAELERISVRDSDGRWTVLRSDNPTLNYTMADAAILAIRLDEISAGPAPSVPAPSVAPAVSVPAGPANSESQFSDADEMRIQTIMELLTVTRDGAIAMLGDKVTPIVPELQLSVGTYSASELPAELQIEVYEVGVKGGGKRTAIRIAK